MRVSGLLLLCLGALASASVITEHNVRLSDSIQHNSGSLEYHLAHTAPGTNLFTEDDVALLFHALSIQDRNLITDQITNFLEGFREVIINGSGDIPVLDPFVIDHIGPFLFTATGVRATGNIRNLRVEGLKWFLVNRVTFNVLRLTLGVQVTVPWIITTGSYDAQASVAIFITHRAGGDFRVFVNRLVVSVDARLGTNIFGGGHLILRELDIKIDIHDVNINIEGMFGSSLLNTFINSFVQSLTQDVIQNELENVSATLSEQLFDVINDVLKEFTLDDLLGSK